MIGPRLERLGYQLISSQDSPLGMEGEASLTLPTGEVLSYYFLYPYPDVEDGKALQLLRRRMAKAGVDRGPRPGDPGYLHIDSRPATAHRPAGR